jgi:hypothetical protein
VQPAVSIQILIDKSRDGTLDTLLQKRFLEPSFYKSASWSQVAALDLTTSRRRGADRSDMQAGGLVMDEIVPVLFCALLGVIIWRGTRGLTRSVLSVLAVIASGAFATVLSGEYVESWLYLLLDLGEATLGLAIGFVVAHRFLPAAKLGARSSAKRDWIWTWR